MRRENGRLIESDYRFNYVEKREWGGGGGGGRCRYVFFMPSRQSSDTFSLFFRPSYLLLPLIFTTHLSLPSVYPPVVGNYLSPRAIGERREGPTASSPPPTKL